MKSKLSEILTSGIAPGISTGTPPVDHNSVYYKAPRGLAAVESEPIYKHGPARGASRIAKHFGMPTNFIKSVWAKAPLIVLLFASLSIHAGDLTPGQNFTDGQTVSAAQLNGLVGNATVNNSLISGKPVDPAPLGGDTFLVYSPTLNGLYRLTLNSGVLQNPALITAQSEKTAPVSGDYLLLWDSVGLTLQKVSVGNLGANSTNFIPSLPALSYTNLTLLENLQVNVNGTNYSVNLTNLFQSFPYAAIFTNLPVRTAPTNYDNLLVAASNDGTNYSMKRMTLSGLMTNPPVATILSNADSILIFATATNGVAAGQSNGVPARVPLSTLATFFNGSVTVTIANLPCTNSLMLQSNLVSTTPPFVRAVLVVTNLAGILTGNYAIGDEIPADQLYVLSTGGPAFSYGSSTTNVWFSGNLGGASFMLSPKLGGGTAGAIDHTNFSGKLYIK